MRKSQQLCQLHFGRASLKRTTEWERLKAEYNLYLSEHYEDMANILNNFTKIEAHAGFYCSDLDLVHWNNYLALENKEKQSNTKEAPVQ